MRIGFVLCEHPVDIRIKKEARTLTAAGHEVAGLLLDEQGDEGIVQTDSIRLHKYAPSHPGEVAKALIFAKRMSFLHIPLEDRIHQFAVQNDLDVLHVHDLPNAGPAIRAARRLGLPVVVDLHENYPVAVRVWMTDHSMRYRLKTCPSIWHSYQKRCLARANKVIVVIEESRDYMLRYGTDPAKIHVVPNYVDLDYLEEQSAGSQPLEEYKDKFVISYIGGLAPHRGVDTAVGAMKLIQDKAPDAVLLIIGNEGVYSDYLRRLIGELSLERYVKMLGWQPFEKIPEFVKASRVGLIPHRRNDHCDNTIPNKLFDYIGLEKPVIVSDCPPLVRITNDARAGLVFQADQPDQLADRLMRIYSNPDLASELGRNGSRAVRSRFNWANAASELMRVYDTLSRMI